jgi:hypothetical protein
MTWNAENRLLRVALDSRDEMIARYIEWILYLERKLLKDPPD